MKEEHFKVCRNIYNNINIKNLGAGLSSAMLSMKVISQE